MDTAEIRRRFVAHFEAAGHQAVPSASLLVPDSDHYFYANPVAAAHRREVYGV